MMSKSRNAILTLTLLATGACASGPATPPDSPTRSQPVRSSGIALENIDQSVRPQDDFYRHVNGAWLERTEIPGDRSNYGSFTQLSEEAEENLRALVEETAAMETAVPGLDAQKVGALYRSFMDTERIETRGIEAVRPELDQVAAISSHEELPTVWGQMAPYGLAPFGSYV